MAELKPFSMYSPPTEPGDRTLLILGEAPGEEEIKESRPFVGSSGKLLDDLLQLAGLHRAQFHITNVFSQRPPANDLKAWTLTKTELRKAGYSEAGRLPQIQKRYLHPEREPEVVRLKAELLRIAPDFIIAVGGTALWALTGDSRITTHRGAFFTAGGFDPASIVPIPCTALATFHPAAVMREWSMRPIVWADLKKVAQWLAGTLVPPISRRIYINPTEAELAYVYNSFRQGLGTELLGLDIETSPAANQLTTFAIGTPEVCICIPVWNAQTLPQLSHCYADAPSEAARWNWIRKFCSLPNPKVMQNGLYDMQYLLDAFDIRPVNVLHDTAILQHALQPELPKDLGTLGSLYLNEPGWKFMRTAKDEGKADE